jgi:hypothetical protein
MGTSLQTIVVSTPIETPDATPIALGVYEIPEGTTCAVDLHVVARGADGTSNFWRLLGACRRESGDPAPVAIAATFDPVAFDPNVFDAGLLFAGTRVEIPARSVIYTLGPDGLTVSATGDAAQVVRWFVNGFVQAYFEDVP